MPPASTSTRSPDAHSSWGALRWVVGLLLLLASGAFGRAAWLDGPWRFQGPLPRVLSATLAPVKAGRTSTPAEARPPAFLLIVADGLREEATGGMPTLSKLAREGASGIAITGEPTMSATCIRSILTG